MRQVLCIFRKEFFAYFSSPIAYIVIAIFLLVTGWFFFSTFFLFNQASLRSFFRLLPIVFAFVVPAVTMRQFAEELNIGSYETLLTLPVRITDIMLGKFLASSAFVAAMLVPTLAYPAIIAFLGDLDGGPVIGGYLGALLLGAAFSAVGLFSSALTRNQIVAFIIGMAICFGLCPSRPDAVFYASDSPEAPRLFIGRRSLREHRQGHDRHAGHRLLRKSIVYQPLRYVSRLAGEELTGVAMSERKPLAGYLKFGLYLLTIVLINAAGLTLFARLDLTRAGIYSLSEASRRVVSTLSEPLTINVFFSRNLPAPYNTVEQYLRDLLEEYAVYGNRFFNYRFYDVSTEEGEITAEARENQKLASTYGIHPIQVQAIEKDEVKFQRVFMGLVLIHGDLIEQLPTIATADGLEYRITTAIQKMNDKISALLRLSGKIRVHLYLSPTLRTIAPLMGLKQLPGLPAEIEKAVQTLNAKTYGKLEYRFSEPPADERFEEVSKANNLLALSWPASNDGKIQAGKGAVGLVVEYRRSQNHPAADRCRAHPDHRDPVQADRHGGPGKPDQQQRRIADRHPQPAGGVGRPRSGAPRRRRARSSARRPPGVRQSARARVAELLDHARPPF